MRRAVSLIFGIGVLTLGGMLMGCTALPLPTPASRSFAIHETTLSCEEANRISYRVVEQLGYTVESFTPASAGGTGTVRGSRGSTGGKDTALVQITCSDNGVHVQAKPGGLTATNVEFPQAFFVRFQGMAGALRRGEAPKPPGQIQVVLTPLVGLEAKLEFGTEARQVFPVRVEISNTTDRSYILNTDRLVLLTPTGDRVPPLSGQEGAFPAPALTSQTLPPGAQIKAYLYYPPGSYTGARGFLIEAQSQEREGFAVQF